MMRGQTLERGRHSPGHHAGSGDFASERLLSRAVPHPMLVLISLTQRTVYVIDGINAEIEYVVDGILRMALNKLLISHITTRHTLS